MNIRYVALLLLIPIVAHGQTYWDFLLPEERTITVTVTDAEGKPVEHAFVDHAIPHSLYESFTDESGRFSTSTRAPAFVVRKYGYESHFVRAEKANAFEIVLKPTASKPMMRRCPADTDCREFVGSLCFLTMDGVNVSKVQRDHDYVAKLYFIPGDTNVWNSVEYQETIFYEQSTLALPDDDARLHLIIRDERGATPEGKRWRYLGRFEESASYSDRTEAETQVLDRVLDSVCLYEGF
jgi:hypothetical protein